MSHINTIEYSTTPTQTNHYFANLVDPTILPTLFSDSEAIAALACAEVLRHSKLAPQLFDNLLTREIKCLQFKASDYIDDDACQDHR